MKFSVVMPIRNEEEFLPHSLPSVYRLEQDEVVLLFDRCTNGSLSIAKAIAKIFNYTKKTRFIEVWEKCSWIFRVAWLRRYGFNLARHDTILTTDADQVLDPEIRRHFNLIGRDSVGLISFGRIDYPFSYQGLIAIFIERYILRILCPQKVLHACYVFSKKCWTETENQELVESALRAEDVHLQLSMSKKYMRKYFPTNTYSLTRPSEQTRERHIIRRRMMWRLLRDSLWKVILHCIIYLIPVILVGYLQERRSR